jgi:hypothetical protein
MVLSLRSRGDPDEYLDSALRTETELYLAIETKVHAKSVAALLRKEPSVADVLAFAMKIQQGRRSRRGQSLEYHFASVLEMTRLPFTAQCTTENGETPDFVLPGCRQYHDEKYPADRLRMVACKSTAKERWRQILNEAARIREKYLLTLDPNLTGHTIEAMSTANVKAFVPRSILDREYSDLPRVSLGSVADLMDALIVDSRSAHA